MKFLQYFPENLFRLLLAVSSTSMMVALYAAVSLNPQFAIEDFCLWAIVVVLAFLPLCLTFMTMLLSRKLNLETFEDGAIVEIEHASNVYLPSYLGYFFVALSVPSWEILTVVVIVLTVFTFHSQAMYFNPILLILGFHFYWTKTGVGTRVLLISRGEYRNAGQIDTIEVRRIDRLTFLELDRR